MSDTIARLNAALEGRYRIEREVGEGGTATVYSAEDLRHDRKVALKVLKPELAAVVGAKRFLTEIKTTANLQHPHILPLFDSGEADGVLFYVMPYVVGESLRERLDREHQLPVDEAVRIASDVAEALDYAHGEGVIHRDVKPGNILLHAGRPVISDFGIALAVGAAGGDRLTETSLSVGTPHYMSPEQATGDLSVGPASDLYALGCVLYEMLVGEPPYTGSSVPAVLAKIVSAEVPSASAVRKSVPPNVDATIRRALEQVPADRFATGAGFRLALRDRSFVHGEGASYQPGTLAPRTRMLDPVCLAGLAIAATLGAVVGVAVMDSPLDDLRAPIRFTVPVGEGEGFYFGDRRYSSLGWPAGTSLALSPDGRSLVYSAWTFAADSVSRASMLYLRQWEQERANPIPGSEDASSPFFSPDGSWVGYLAGPSLRRYSLVSGTSETLVAEIPLAVGGLRGASWGDDGSIVYGAAGGLYRVGAGGGAPTLVADLRAPPAEFMRYDQPHVLPGSRWVLFHGKRSSDPSSAEILALDLSTGELKKVLSNAMDPRYVRTGHLLFMRLGTLMGIPFDAEQMAVRGEAVVLMENVMQAVGMVNNAWDSGAGQFTATASGHLAYVPGGIAPEVPRVLTRVTQGGAADTLPLPPRAYMSVRVSPDGGRLATYVNTGLDRSIFVHDLTREVTMRLETGAYRSLWPIWSPDGEYLAYTSDREDGHDNAYRIRVDGRLGPERLAPSERGQTVSDWSSEGVIAFLEGGDIWMLPPGGPARPFFRSDAVESYATFSPDGRLVAYVSDQRGSAAIFVRAYPDPGSAVQVSGNGGRSPTWSPDGARLYFLVGQSPPTLMAVDVSTEVGLRIGRAKPIMHPWPHFVTVMVTSEDVLADGSFIAIADAPESGDATLGAGAHEIHVVLNYLGEISQRMGANWRPDQ